MSLLSEINDLKIASVAVTTILFNATIAPGILIIYHFKPEVFLTLDIFRLILLSLSFTTPLLGLHDFLGSIAVAHKEKLTLGASFVFGALVSMYIFSIALISAYYWKMSLGKFLGEVFWLEVSFTIVCLIMRGEYKREAEKAKRETALKPS